MGLSSKNREPVMVKEVEIPKVSDRAKQALEVINKAIPNGLMLMSGKVKKMPVISSGCLSIDKALGIGGLPYGRIVEVYGPESSGKTTLCLHIAASCQKQGGVCAFIDVEHALDPSYAQNLGVRVKDLLISQPDYGEQALEIASMLCDVFKTGDLIVVDSVAALVPKSELEGEMIDQNIGLQARLMSKAMRVLKGKLNKAGILCMFVNQIRDKIGVTWGSPTDTSGGRALKFYSSIRLEVRKIGSVKQGETVIANRTRMKVVKNKVAPPFTECEFDIRFGEGIDFVADLLDYSIQLNTVKKAGSWYSFGDAQLGQGRENTLSFLKDKSNKKIQEEILKEVKESYGQNTDR